MSEQLRVEVTEARERLAVVTAAGELDLLTAPELYQLGAGTIEEHPTLILEMSGVTFCDSSGFNALLRLRRRALDAGGQLVLAAPPDQVERLLALTGAEGAIPVHPTLAQARAAHPE
jgi:anti-sigma B factor antagonist